MARYDYGIEKAFVCIILGLLTMLLVWIGFYFSGFNMNVPNPDLGCAYFISLTCGVGCALIAWIAFNA